MESGFYICPLQNRYSTVKNHHKRSSEDNPKTVITSNDLIHAKYSFTLWQKRVFAYMVSDLDGASEQQFSMQKMYVRDLMDFFKVKNKDDYNVIQRIPEQLYDMSMKMAYSSEKGHKRWREVRILSQFTRPEDKEEDNAYIELKFNDDLKPHLLELKKLFSQYDIRNIIHLRSVYSFKIYELMKANESLSQWEIGLEEFKEMLDVEDKYKHYGSFKLKIVNQAQKDLTECCDVTFTYEEQTIGKRVEGFIFQVQKNQPTREQKTQVNEAQSEPIFLQKMGQNTEGGKKSAENTVFDGLFATYFEQIKPHGIAAHTLIQWIAQYPSAHIEACIREFLDKVQKGKLNTKETHQQGGYLRILIEKADFTGKEQQKQQKEVVQKQQETREQQGRVVAQTARQDAAAKYEQEVATMWAIFRENPELEPEIFADIARREGTVYTSEDYVKLPFLTSKVLFLVKKRFLERF
jgi:plasmid replication initiation protein